MLNYSAIQSGLTFLPLTVSALLGARWINKLVTTAGVAGTIAIGMGLGAIGFMLLTRLSETGSAWGVIPGTVIIGFGQAFVFTTMYIAASTGIDMKEQGVASAIVTTGQQIGGAVGLAVIMAIISVSLGTNATLETMEAGALNGSVRTAMIVEAGIALLSILVALLTLRPKKAAEANAAA